MRKTARTAVNATSDLNNDLKLLSELPPGWTPEFLMKVSQPSASKHRVATAEIAGVHGVATAGGHYRTTRDVLMSPELVEQSIENLRSMLSDCDKKHDASSPSTLIDAWIAVEPCLTGHEREELHKRVVAHAFPNSSQTVRISRNAYSAAEGE